MNYYRRYMADYLSKTANLSLAEHGAYTLLLDYSYLADGVLPGDVDELCRMVRAITPSERQAVTKILNRFFVLGGGQYSNPRAAREIEKAKPAMDAARANGLKGGRPKNNPPGFETEPSAKASQPLTPNHQPPAPIPQPLKKERAAPRGSRLLLDSLPGEWKDYCLAERVDLDPDRVFADFSDYWKAKPGKDGVKLDWLATWRKWVRNSREGKGPAKSLAQLMDERDRRAAN